MRPKCIAQLRNTWPGKTLPNKNILVELSQAFKKKKNAQTFSSNQDQKHNLIIDSSYIIKFYKFYFSSDLDTQNYGTFITSRDGELCLSF